MPTACSPPSAPWPTPSSEATVTSPSGASSTSQPHHLKTPKPHNLTTPHPHNLTTYVIDERGYHTLLTQVLSLQNELKQDYHIELPPITLLPIRIERSEEALTATIDPARLARDADRTDTAHIPYRITIHNDAPTAADLTAWAQTQLSPALRMWLSHGKPALTRNTPTTHLSASMGIAEIIAHLNGAL